MDDQQKIAKACEILGRYNVGKNLSFIYNNCFPALDDLTWDKSVNVSSATKGEKIVAFFLEDVHFQLLTENKRGTFDGTEEWSDFTLSVDREAVLRSIMRHSCGEWGSSGNLDISPLFLKSARLGPWMDAIQYAHDKLEAQIATLRKEREERDLKDKSDQIDLGNY